MVQNDIKLNQTKNKSFLEFDPFPNEPKISNLFYRYTPSQKIKIKHKFLRVNMHQFLSNDTPKIYNGVQE